MHAVTTCISDFEQPQLEDAIGTKAGTKQDHSKGSRSPKHLLAFSLSEKRPWEGTLSYQLGWIKRRLKIPAINPQQGTHNPFHTTSITGVPLIAQSAAEEKPVPISELKNLISWLPDFSAEISSLCKSQLQASPAGGPPHPLIEKAVSLTSGHKHAELNSEEGKTGKPAAMERC